jgi:FkbM family methyltransferase
MKFLSSVFYALGKLSKRIFDKIARILYTPKPTHQDEQWKGFYNAGGEAIRFNYSTLNHNSIVFDLGGYEGQWASDIYGRFRSKIYVFEVYTPFYTNIKQRFTYNDDILIYNFGLSSTNAVVPISIDAFSTSAFKETANMVNIELKKASDFIYENDISKIDLMKINIEGGEYELLDHLIESGIVKMIANIQIQFHDFVPNAINEMNSLRERLSITHSPRYKFDFIWDNWVLKQ